MPSCKFFLEGLCARENCPYRHVKVNPNADVCPEYLKGYCSAGQDCKRRHVSRCPQFEKTGVCARGAKCPYPHAAKKASSSKLEDPAPPLPPPKPAKTPSKRAAKTPPPPKPKRKSIGSATVDSKKARMRYFDRQPSAEAEREKKKDEEEKSEDVATPLAASAANLSSSSLEAKRKRLLRKVELAKQAWNGSMVEEKEEEETDKRDSNSVADMDDSGPYEEIDEGEEEEDTARAPLGDLPSYIPLDSGGGVQAVEEEEDEGPVDERLI